LIETPCAGGRHFSGRKHMSSKVKDSNYVAHPRYGCDQFARV
jgi:hypothetical protein